MDHKHYGHCGYSHLASFQTILALRLSRIGKKGEKFQEAVLNDREEEETVAGYTLL